MQTIETTATVGDDGHLRLDLPADAGEYQVRVTITPKPPAADPGRRPTPEELGWPPGYFEATAGSIPDFSIEPRDQGLYEAREEL